MNATREQRVAKVLAEAPTSCRKALRDAFSGSASPRAAIKAMCLACVGYDREEIKNCTGWSCPLWKYRPFQDQSVEPEAAATDTASVGKVGA